MKNYKQFFDSIAYLYYPTNMYQCDEGFFLKKESKLLCDKISTFDQNEFDILILQIKRELNTNKITEFNMGKNFPSYIIQIDLAQDSIYKRVAVIYLSYLIPFFHIAFLKGNFLNKKIKKEILNEPINILLINKIKSIIKEFTSYEEFSNEIICKRIPKLIISEEFNYFNAFFSDYHRINNF